MKHQYSVVIDTTDAYVTTSRITQLLESQWAHSSITVTEGNLVEAGDQRGDTILPWRVKYRGDTTVAAFDHYPTENEVFAELTYLRGSVGHDADSLSDLTVHYATEEI